MKDSMYEKFITEEHIKGLQSLNIDKEIPTKMSDKMSQHLTQDYELSHEYCVIKGRLMLRLEVLQILNNLQWLGRIS